jgi:hypothetical protein
MARNKSRLGYDYKQVISRMRSVYREKNGVDKASIEKMVQSIQMQTTEFTNMRNRGVDANLVAIFAREYNVSLEWLLTGEKKEAEDGTLPTDLNPAQKAILNLITINPGLAQSIVDHLRFIPKGTK